MNKRTYQVFWTQTARQDLLRIIQYIRADSNNQAEKVYLAIKQKAVHLQQLPLRGRIVPELRYYGILIYRELISRPWRIMYRVEKNTVWVIAVIDSRMNVEDILLNRFLGEGM